MADSALQTDDEQVLERLSWLAMVMPAIFLLGLLGLVLLVLVDALPRVSAFALAFLAGGVGIVAFTHVMFGAIEGLQARLKRQNHDLEQRTRQLLALCGAGEDIAALTSLASVLRNVVESSRELVDARYGAIAVVEDGEIRHFVTSGLSDEEIAAIGDPPSGKGLIGHLLEIGVPYRTTDMASDPHAAGFPERHPAMHSLLGVPVVHEGSAIGNIYLTDKNHGEFTAEDEEIVGRFAVQAAIAIEKARLNSQIEEVAVLRERERIAIDLHDGTIQSLYGVGLRIEDCIERLETEPAAVREDLDGAIENLNTIIRGIRSYIFDLRPDGNLGDGLQASLKELLQDLSVNTLMTTELKVMEADGDDPSQVLSPDQTQHLFGIAREAMSNIRKHSRANNVYAEIGLNDGRFQLRIVDDGVGASLEEALPEDGGLLRMKETAQSLGGNLILEPVEEGGTSLTVEIPVAPERSHD